MEQIVRGTTPSLIIEFSGVTEIPDFSVEDISAASLVIKRRTERLELGLADMSVEDNKLSYHFTQEQTLAFIPKIVAVFVAILIFGPWMLRIMVEYFTNTFVNLPLYIK